MAYQLNKSNGASLVLLNDGLVDTALTSLTLIGKNVSNFGDAQNENFLFLLENFASSFQPRSPTAGQIWFDSNARVFRPAVFDGNNWRPLAVLQYSNTTTDTLVNAGGNSFAASTPGDLWFNSSSKNLYVITSTASDMTLIGPSIPVGDTPPANPPIGTLWWDSAYNNLRIYYKDIDSSQWVDAVASVQGPQGVKGDKGDTGPMGPVGSADGIPTQVVYLSSTSTLVGSSNLTFNGTNLSAAGIVTTVITSGGVTTPGTITGKWTLTTGTSLQATYADIAEWYSADADYEPGTVLTFGGTAELTETEIENDKRVAGVVTTNPSYVLNDSLQGMRACIALQGRVPVKVIGTVQKGDMLTTSNVKGYAMVATDPKLGTIIGKALENKDTTEPGTIEVAVGRN
jgi:hypothetical protein